MIIRQGRLKVAKIPPSPPVTVQDGRDYKLIFALVSLLFSPSSRLREVLLCTCLHTNTRRFSVHFFCRADVQPSPVLKCSRAAVDI